jgi:8-oxo-dGTP diphosphatase
MNFTQENSNLSQDAIIIPVVAVALLDEAERVLLQRRRTGGEHGGLWEFPGGKIEYGESPQSALVREVREELGVEIDANDLFPVGYACDPPGMCQQRNRYLILLFGARKWLNEPRCLVGEALGWFAVSELSDLKMPPLDIPLALNLAACQSREGHLCAPLPRP